jgi:hypothetical protein
MGTTVIKIKRKKNLTVRVSSAQGTASLRGDEDGWNVCFLHQLIQWFKPNAINRAL